MLRRPIDRRRPSIPDSCLRRSRIFVCCTSRTRWPCPIGDSGRGVLSAWSPKSGRKVRLKGIVFSLSPVLTACSKTDAPGSSAPFNADVRQRSLHEKEECVMAAMTPVKQGGLIVVRPGDSSYWPKPRLQADRLKEASLVNGAETHAAEIRNTRLDNPFLNCRYRIARLTKLGALDKSFCINFFMIYGGNRCPKALEPF